MGAYKRKGAMHYSRMIAKRNLEFSRTEAGYVRSFQRLAKKWFGPRWQANEDVADKARLFGAFSGLDFLQLMGWE